MDLTGWWASAGEVREWATDEGWSEDDLQGALLAWMEAKKAGVKSLPRVLVPEEVPGLRPSAPTPPSRGAGPISTSTLAPTDRPCSPTDPRHLAQLHAIYMAVGAEGAFWDPDAPEEQFQLLVRTAIRAEPSHISQCLTSWQRWCE